MSLVHVSWAGLLIALGQLLIAFGHKDGPAFWAALTAVASCFLPSVLAWMKPKDLMDQRIVS